MKQQIVVLKVTYNEADGTFADILRVSPAEWDWTVLADDEVEVIAAGPVTEAPDDDYPPEGEPYDDGSWEREQYNRGLEEESLGRPLFPNEY